jgi:anti-anti-sigma regulatory factor
MDSPQSARLNLTEIDGYLIVNLPAVITDPLLSDHYDQIRRLVGISHYHGVILNLSAVSLLDYGALQQIRRIAKANTLLGSNTVLASANSSIAAYLACLPDAIEDLTFCQDMESAKRACG